jgi:anti-sigma regulatory factor (Ser/Thr protein kinase)
MTFVYTTNLSEVRVLAETQARMAGLAEDRVTDFVIAVSEIAANTVRHARSAGSMEIWCAAGELVCEMRDSGVITDPTAGRLPPAADANGGHGLWLVYQICDKVELNSNSSGTIIQLHMSLPPTGSEGHDWPGPNGATAPPDVASKRILSLPELYSYIGCTPMDVGGSQLRMAAFLRDNQDKVVGSWSELVAAGLRGRTSAAEVRRELEDLYSLLIRDMSGADEHAAG